MFEEKTPEGIKKEIMARLKTDIDTREGSYTNDLVGPVALNIWKVYDELNALLPIAYIDETSGQYIDKKCESLGIYRKAGTKSKVVLQFTGTNGAVIPKGTVVLTGTGQEFVTQKAAVIAEGTALISSEAEEVGSDYNVQQNTIVNQYNSMSGITGVTNPEPAIGGSDPESDKSLVQRYYAYVRKPPTSGNRYHYEQWALESPGVGGVKVTPLEFGPGTVGILITSPEKQPVDNEIVAGCAAHIEENRPVGATVTVKSAEAFTINVSAVVKMNSSTTIERVREEFLKRLNTYLQTVAETYMKAPELKEYELLYNQVTYHLMELDGVEDFSDLTINGAKGNLKIAAAQVPVIGKVEVTL